MKIPHVFSASAATVLAMTMAAFAESAQSQSPPAPQGQAPAAAQAGKQPETPVTLVGCVMRESEYRKANSAGRGGPAATGAGLGNEFVLVNATKGAAGASASAADCSSASAAAGEAYELTGNRERELDKFVGRRVEITGTLKQAKTEPGAGGEPKPTGGFDPLKQDLKLFEVEVASFREAPAGQSAGVAQQPASPPAPAAQQAPAPRTPPPAQPAQPEPPPSPSAAPRQQLPRTATPLPLIGLIGMLSLGLGIGLLRRS
jgi:hypothetical protein